MRSAVMFAVSPLLLAATACELQPPPPQPAAAPPTAAPPPTQAPAPPPVVTADAGPAPAVRQLPPITPRCLEVARHVANVLIASAEPSQRAIFEAERDRIERSTGDVCTAQAWSEPAMTCYLAAKTQLELKTCEAKFPLPSARPAPPAAGGSAAAPPVRGPDGKIDEPATPPPARPAGTGSAAPPVRRPRPAATPTQPKPTQPKPAQPKPAQPKSGGLMPPRSGSAGTR